MVYHNHTHSYQCTLIQIPKYLKVQLQYMNFWIRPSVKRSNVLNTVSVLWCVGHASLCPDRPLTLCFIIVGLSDGCRKGEKEIIIINYCGFACQAHAYSVATQIVVLITFRKKCHGFSDWWLYQMMKAAAPCQLKLHPECNWDAFSSYYGSVSARLLKLENESNKSLYITSTVRNICIFQRVHCSEWTILGLACSFFS